MSNNLVKKVTASVAALSIVMSIVSPVVGVKANDSAVEAANRLAALGVIVDNAANPSAYNLDGSITRREMLKVMMNLSDVEVTDTCEGKFADLPSSDWGCKYAEAALNAGFIAANTNFRPNDLVSKSEALKMVMQAKGIAKKEGVSSWQEAYAQAAVEAGVIETAFTDYTSVAKRSMVIVTADSAVTSTSTSVDGDEGDLDLSDIFGPDVDMGTSTGTTSTGTTTDTTNNNNNTNTNTTTPVANGDLELSLNPASPAYGAQVPKAGTVRFAKVDFTAGSADVSLNSVELKKVGLASVDSNTKVYFEKNGSRVSSRVGFTSEGNVVMSFAPAFVVKAGTTETLDLYVELNGVAGIDYEFVSGKVVSSAANVTGSFSTPRLRTAEYSVATATVSIASAGSSYNASEDLVELGAFKVAATDSKSEETDLSFQSVMLTASGSASLTNLTDIQLVRNDVVVSTSAVVDGKELTFQVNDTIKEGVTATYYVKARVTNVEDATDKYNFRLKNISDLNIVEIKNGFRATVVGTPTLNLYTVKGGEVKFARDSSVELSKTYAPGTSDVVLMKGTINAKNAVRLEDINLSFTKPAAKALSEYFTTVNLVIGGTSFSTSAPTVSGTTTIEFNGSVYVNGTVDVKLYGSLKSNAPVGTVKFNELKLSSFDTKEFVSNDEPVNSGVGSIPGVNVDVADTTLNVSRNDALGNTNLAAGSKGVTLYGVRLSSSQGNPVNVTSATINFTGTNNSTSTGHLNNVFATLYVNGNAVSSKTVDQANVKFDGFNVTVSKDSSVDIVVKADLSDSFANGTIKATLNTLTAVDSVSSDTVTGFATPAGATFTIASADAVFASSDNNPKASLLEAGKTNNKVFAFKITGKNDTVKVKDVTLSGSNANLSNYRLTNASNVEVAFGTVTSTGVKFENINSDNASVAMDKSTTFYVVADANSNSTGSVNLELTSAVIAGTNGLESTKAVSNVKSNTHFVAENVLVIAKSANASKSLSSSAMVFTVTASGKDQVTLSGATFNRIVTGYTNSGTVKVYKDSVSAGNLVDFSTKANATVDAGSTVTFIVTVEGAQKDATANTISYELQLTDIVTTEISSVKSYLNAGSFPFVETINN